jgi:thymidylate synthase ThyX
MCEHYKTVHHINGSTHLVHLIEEGLIRVGENISNTSVLQDKLKDYDNKAQKNQIAKDDLKAKLDEKLLKLKNLFKEQENLASHNHADILRCHEKTYKEIRKCESKLKENLSDPQKIDRKVKEMVKNQRYWEGYEELKRALEDTTKLDDKEISKNLKEYDKLLEEHQTLLAALEITPASTSEFRFNKEENELLKSNLGYLSSRKVDGN